MPPHFFLFIPILYLSNLHVPSVRTGYLKSAIALVFPPKSTPDVKSSRCRPKLF